MIKKALTVIAALAFCVGMQAQTLEAETMTLGGSYAGTCSSPFQGVVLYGNGDNATGVVSLTNGSGVYSIKVTGASSDNTAAGVALYVGGKKMADMSFSGTAPSVQQVQTKLYLDASSVDVKLNLENDNGSNDTYIDKIEFEFVKALPTRTTPVLPQQSVWQSGEYRNILLEAGYSQEEINSKLQAIKQQFFEGDAENGRLYYELGTDEAYILDTGNDDVRTESLSYGMMICVQLNMQTEFDKLWRFTKNHSMHKSGANKGYLAWQLNTDGSIKDDNAAPDGDEYIATALMFAAGRWGNNTGIDYWKEANCILENMLSKSHYVNSSHVNMFNKDEKQIVFVPYAQSAVHTDPSYHMPAFYELWSKWANNNRQFWKECADKSREMYPKFANGTTGLMPDYAEFSGEARSGEHSDFRYDAWRCAMHMATDYMWFNGSETEKQQTKKLLDFFYGEGIKDYKALYKLDGTAIYGGDHSPGLVGCNAVGAMIYEDVKAWDFVDDFYEMTFPTGHYRYYDGCLYFLSYLHASGNFKMYKPAEVLTTALDEQYKTDSNGFLIIDDFENVPEGKEYYMHCRDNSSSAATLVADPKNGSNYVVSIEPKSYDDYYYHAFRLPQGKTLGGNYESIEFDILFDGASYNNETLNVFLNDYSQPIYTESTGAKAEQTAWKHISVEVPAGNTDNEFVFGLGVRAGSGICYVDNLKLRPNGAPEPDPTPGGNDDPTPGPTTDSRNGTYFTDNDVKYYMIEDFEDKTVGTTTAMQNNGGTATVSDEHKMEGDKALKVNIGEKYQGNGCYAIDVTLPEGVTLSDSKFSAINFDIYYEAGSIQYKGAEYNTGVKVWLNDINNMIIQHDTKGCLGQTENIAVPLEGKFTNTNSFKLLIGGLCSDNDNDGIYYIDNVRLVCKEETEEPGGEDDPTPGPTPGGDGEDTDYVVLEDFDSYAVDATPYLVENANGSSLTVQADPEKEGKALKFITGSYKNNEYVKFDFTLPTGMTLSDYDVLSFDYRFFNNEGDGATYKDIKVAVNSTSSTVKSWSTQGNPPYTWTTQSIDISSLEGGNTFTLYIGGINANCLRMMIDNIIIKKAGAGPAVFNKIEGTNISWNLNSETGVLTFKGTGDMPNYSGWWATPWHDAEGDRGCQETKVILPEGITSIGDACFDSNNLLADITIPSTVTKIGKNAFANCVSLNNLVIPENVQQIGDGAFNMTYGENKTYILKSIPAVGDNSFNVDGKSVTLNLVLSDEEKPYITQSQNLPTFASATYKRNVTAGYSTICLPFAVADLGSVTAYGLSKTAGDVVTFSKVTALEAGVPYLVETANITFTVDDPEITVQPQTSTAAGVAFAGVFQKKELTADDHAYGLKDGVFYLNATKMTTNPLRAYLYTTGAAQAKMMLNVVDGDATGITEMQTTVADTDAVYDLTGRLQSRLQKGLNIITVRGGKAVKVIVK